MMVVLWLKQYTVEPNCAFRHSSTGMRNVLSSLAKHWEAQCLASQSLGNYEAVGKAFAVCNDITKEYAAML